jgi:UDP:flavonoid glycosyltransferase YjiC (YdhE family)
VSNASGRILFVTSNGTGLGHLTRSMAIARRLRPGIESLFFTLSRAAPVVRQVGFAVEYAASHGSPAAGSDWRWSRRMGPRLRAVIEEADPRILVFDGILPYDPLLAAMKDVPSTVWCRRPLWRAGASTAPLTRSDLFDAILEPGEFAASEDAGPTASRAHETHQVPPIVFLNDDELLPRAEAATELGLDPAKPTILIQLGQGPEVASATDRCLRALAKRDDIQVAAASSAIAGLLDVPAGIVHLRSTYPMSRYYAAFDGAVAAAGYNAFHELIRFRIPTLFVPMQRETDDQRARATYAMQTGVAVAVENPDDPALEQRLDSLLDPARRKEMQERLTAQRPENGAAEAARWLEQLVDQPTAGDPQRAPRKPDEHGLRGATAPTHGRGRGLLGARWGSAARAGVFVKTVPRTVVRLIRQTLTQPKPKLVILALGADDETQEGGITDALKGQSPERVLVVTDSLAIREVWRLGAGLEHVPGRGERQAELAGTDYERFRRRRLALILAQRPRFERVVAIGDVPDELRDAVVDTPRRRRRRLLA